MNPFLHVSLPLGALACILPASGEVIYSNLLNIAIPKTNDGIYLNVLSGASGASPVIGWHINPTFGGIHVYNSADFQPLRETASATGMLSRFTAGGVIGSSSKFFMSGFGASGDHLGIGGTFTAGTEGFMGFSVVDGSNTNYGWMRVVFTGTGTPLIKDWAYDTGGGSIAAGNVIQSGSTYTLDSSTQSFTLGSAFTGSHEVVVQGDNTVIFSSAHSFTGGTRISGGTLALGPAGSIEATSRITVDNGAIFNVSAAPETWTLGASQTLSGTGTVIGDLRIAGTHAPGDSLGLQSLDGDTTYGSTSILYWDLEGNIDTATGGIRAVDYDAVNISGSLTVESGADFRAILNPGLQLSDPFWLGHRQWTDIFRVDGNVSGWASDSMVAAFDITNKPVDVSSYGSFSISGTTLSWTPIPEPTPHALIGILLAAGLLKRRRRNAPAQARQPDSRGGP